MLIFSGAVFFGLYIITDAFDSFEVKVFTIFTYVRSSFDTEKNFIIFRCFKVLSNCTPRVTFEQLLQPSALPGKFLESVSKIDYTSPVTKINVAVNKLPNFTANPGPPSQVMPHHKCTIHMVIIQNFVK